MTLVGGAAYGAYKGHKDPQVVTDPLHDPFPYLRVRPTENTKLYSVSQKKEEKDEEEELHRDLLDILNGKFNGEV